MSVIHDRIIVQRHEGEPVRVAMVQLNEPQRSARLLSPLTQDFRPLLGPTYTTPTCHKHTSQPCP